MFTDVSWWHRSCRKFPPSASLDVWVHVPGCRSSEQSERVHLVFGTLWPANLLLAVGPPQRSLPNRWAETTHLWLKYYTRKAHKLHSWKMIIRLFTEPLIDPVKYLWYSVGISINFMWGVVADMVGLRTMVVYGMLLGGLLTLGEYVSWLSLYHEMSLFVQGVSPVASCG